MSMKDVASWDLGEAGVTTAKSLCPTQGKQGWNIYVKVLCG